MSDLRHRPRKRFGQNFLQDASVIRQIVDAVAPAHDDTVVEIGPGLGALTRELLEAVKTLHVVELDRDLAAQLPQRLGHPANLVVYQADALHFDFAQLWVDTKNKPIKIVGNLPYNVSTPLMLRLMHTLPEVERLVFMVQAEVADRLVAVPGNKDYGRLTLMTQYFCQIETLFAVSNQAFYPVPKVMSAVIACFPHRSLPYVAHNFSTFEQLVKQAFGQRRKTIANTLKTRVSVEQLRAAGISPRSRPEQVSLAQFVHLSNIVGAASPA
jgi:16S rRNA (adenine1518-N6/adenine1519-N6)-dimethyltransferase